VEPTVHGCVQRYRICTLSTVLNVTLACPRHVVCNMSCRATASACLCTLLEALLDAWLLYKYKFGSHSDRILATIEAVLKAQYQNVCACQMGA
jgi:hypothetical protein